MAKALVVILWVCLLSAPLVLPSFLHPALCSQRQTQVDCIKGFLCPLLLVILASGRQQLETRLEGGVVRVFLLQLPLCQTAMGIKTTSFRPLLSCPHPFKPRAEWSV